MQVELRLAGGCALAWPFVKLAFTHRGAPSRGDPAQRS